MANKQCKAPYYVIGVYSSPWVLTPEGLGTEAKARSAIRWQGGQESDWAVASRTGPDTFAECGGEGRSFVVGRGPYTEDAFENFKRAWRHEI